jgi:hypothetical protein
MHLQHRTTIEQRLRASLDKRRCVCVGVVSQWVGADGGHHAVVHRNGAQAPHETVPSFYRMKQEINRAADA